MGNPVSVVTNLSSLQVPNGAGRLPAERAKPERQAPAAPAPGGEEDRTPPAAADVERQNIMASESAVEDTAAASAVTGRAGELIRQQPGKASLAQANASPLQVFSLFG